MRHNFISDSLVFLKKITLNPADFILEQEIHQKNLDELIDFLEHLKNHDFEKGKDLMAEFKDKAPLFTPLIAYFENLSLVLQGDFKRRASFLTDYLKKLSSLSKNNRSKTGGAL